MAARIPCIESVIRQFQFGYEVSDTPAMLMATMQKDDRAFRRRGQGRPGPIEQRRAVMGDEFGFCHGPRDFGFRAVSICLCV